MPDDAPVTRMWEPSICTPCLLVRRAAGSAVAAGRAGGRGIGRRAGDGVLVLGCALQVLGDEQGECHRRGVFRFARRRGHFRRAASARSACSQSTAPAPRRRTNTWVSGGGSDRSSTDAARLLAHVERAEARPPVEDEGEEDAAHGDGSREVVRGGVGAVGLDVDRQVRPGGSAAVLGVDQRGPGDVQAQRLRPSGPSSFTSAVRLDGGSRGSGPGSRRPRRHRHWPA